MIIDQLTIIILPSLCRTEPPPGAADSPGPERRRPGGPLPPLRHPVRLRRVRRQDRRPRPREAARDLQLSRRARGERARDQDQAGRCPRQPRGESLGQGMN